MHAAGPLGDDTQPRKMRVTVALGTGTGAPCPRGSKRVRGRGPVGFV